MKVSFLRKKNEWSPLGRACPPNKQRKVVFVSAKVLLFTQTSRSWSWGSPQAGCLDQRWPFCRGPAHHAHKETSARATEGLRHLHHTQNCCQYPGAKFSPTKASPDQNQAAWPVEQHQHLWLKDSFYLAPTPSCTICPQQRAGRGEGHPLPPRSPTPLQLKDKRSGQGVVLTAGGGGEESWSRPLLYQIDLCSIHFTGSKCCMNFEHYN